MKLLKRKDRSEEKPDLRPFADQCERVRTFSGQVAHLRHPGRGIACADMHDWPGEWFPAPDSMPVHARCLRAAAAEDQARAAS